MGEAFPHWRPTPENAVRFDLLHEVDAPKARGAPHRGSEMRKIESIGREGLPELERFTPKPRAEAAPRPGSDS